MFIFLISMPNFIMNDKINSKRRNIQDTYIVLLYSNIVRENIWKYLRVTVNSERDRGGIGR